MSTDWEDRYRTGDMPWEKGAASPGLVDFLEGYSNSSRGSVLVPGCGTGHDARAFAAAGFEVTGMDLAPSAIRLARESTKQNGLKVTFVRGNLLSDPPERTYDWIFEHTLFCAIDPLRRHDYALGVRNRLRPEGNFLAVFYLITDVKGPPFGTTRPEIISRFSPHFALKSDWIPRSYANRVGLEWMTWWVRR